MGDQLITCLRLSSERRTPNRKMSASHGENTKLTVQKSKIYHNIVHFALLSIYVALRGPSSSTGLVSNSLARQHKYCAWLSSNACFTLKPPKHHQKNKNENEKRQSSSPSPSAKREERRNLRITITQTIPPSPTPPIPSHDIATPPLALPLLLPMPRTAHLTHTLVRNHRPGGAKTRDVARVAHMTLRASIRGCENIRRRGGRPILLRGRAMRSLLRTLRGGRARTTSRGAGAGLGLAPALAGLGLLAGCGALCARAVVGVVA